jgi:hypothetical protein
MDILNFEDVITFKKMFNSKFTAIVTFALLAVVSAAPFMRFLFPYFLKLYISYLV